MTRLARRALLAPAFLVAALAAAAPAAAEISIPVQPPYAVLDDGPVAAPEFPDVVTGDVDRDGYPDAVSTAGGNHIYLALGGADGLGAATVVSNPSHKAWAIAVGDVTGDGRPDIVRTGVHDLATYAGAGDGTFSPDYLNGGLFDCATTLVLGDVDRDGDLDVVSACPSGRVITYRNDGIGNFDDVVSFFLPLGASPSNVRLLDADGDGILDVAANDTAAGGNAYLAPGNGDGTFGAAIAAPGFGARDGLAVSDVDRDGIPDLVGLDGGDDAAVSVGLGNGDGTFAAGAPVPLLNGDAADVAVADLDRDGRLDVMTSGPHGVETLAGNGDGTLQLPLEQSPAWATAHAVDDFDGDGLADAALLDNDGDEIYYARNTTAIAPSNVFSTVTPRPATNNGPAGTTIADVDLDGVPDLLVAQQTASRIGVFLGNGDGTYKPREDYWPGGNSPTNVVAADIDRDGIPDLVAGNALSSSIGVMLGNGDGTFAAAIQVELGLFNNSTGVQVADLNRDRKLDIVSAGGLDGQKVSVVLGNGDGTFQSPTTTSFSGAGAGLQIGDFNRDGKPDVAVLGGGASRVYILLGNGNGTLQAPVPYSLPSFSSPQAIATADLDRDGRLDLVTANYFASSVSVLRGNGDGTFQARSDYPVTGSPRGLAVGDVDRDGKLDVVVTDGAGPASASVLAGNGDGTLRSEAIHTVGVSSYGVAVGDVNRDGRNDIVAPSYTTRELHILLAGVDATPPTTSDNVPGGWATTSPFRPTLTATDSGGGTVAVTYYEVGNPPAPPTTSSSVYNPSSRPSMTAGQQISYFSVDSAGNAEAVKTSAAIKIDANGPVTADDVPTTWQKAPVTVTLTASDTGGSGVATTRYTIGSAPSNPNGASPVYNPASKPVLQNGQRIRYQSLDAAGNVETSKTSIAAKVDTAVPTVSDDLPSTWQKAPVTVTLTAADTGGSGLDKTYYEVGASPAVPTTASEVYDSSDKPVLQDGQKISYFTRDVAGNDSAVHTSDAAKVDTAIPATSDDVPSTWQSSAVTVTLTAADTGGSGLDKTYYEVGASPAAPTTSSSVYDPSDKPVLQHGERISYFSTDLAGNAEEVRTSDAAQVDEEVPDTSLDDVPAAISAEPQPTVTFSSEGVDATFECAVDDGPFEPCTSPFAPAAPLLDGEHEIAVRAKGRSGLIDPTPASVAFVVDTTAPDAPTLVEGPPAASTATDAIVRFSGEDGATFSCSVDGAAEAPCSSPLALTGLALGDHTVRIEQTDEAGNRSQALTVSFSVVEPAPPAQGDGKPAEPAAADPTALSPRLGRGGGWSSRSAILIADISAVACSPDRGQVASCRVEAFRARSLRTKAGRRLAAGAVLATGNASAGGAGSSMTRLRLTADGRRALAGRPLGLRVRLRLRGTGAHGTVVLGATRARLMSSDTVAIPIAGRPLSLPRRTRATLTRFVRAVGIAKSVRCTAHTDASGDAKADRALTVSQAKAACDHLAARGLKATRKVAGRGSSRPLASNRTDRGRALNRRLTIRFALGG